ncbi:MAG: glycosyltransferase family 9 protein, partial [Candidatus Omnitrophica bacterium]|nr:glycosyltransferase family 9 protein [Candidatus Omnitrophota bacterium]
PLRWTMSFRVSNKSKVHKILVISLSNIGDVVLTLPVVDILRRDFPAAAISIVIGPKVESLLRDSPQFDKVYLLQKKQPWPVAWSWIRQLRRARFDLVVDLRNSMIPYMLFPRYMTPPEFGKNKRHHMRDKHLARLRTVYPFAEGPVARASLATSPEDSRLVDGLLRQEGAAKPFVVMAPGSADKGKRWSQIGFAAVAKHLKNEFGLETVFLGDQQDDKIVREILSTCEVPMRNLCGQTTLCQSAEIVRRSVLVVVNDSAVLHLAGYHNVPSVAVFGYTDPVKYGPWSEQRVVLRPAKARLPEPSTTREKVAYIESVPAAAVINSIGYTDGKVILSQP